MVFIKKVIPCLIIDFHVTYTNFELLCCILLRLTKNITQCSGDNTTISVSLSTTSYSKCFTRSCLTISENSSIITFKTVIYNIFCNPIKNCFLLNQHVKYSIVLKLIVIVLYLIISKSFSLKVKLDLAFVDRKP
jgi:hypothetical protein